MSLIRAEPAGPVKAGIVPALAHRLARGLVSLAVVSVSHPMRSGDGGGLGDANELEARGAVARDALERGRPGGRCGLAHGAVTLVRCARPRTNESLGRAFDEREWGAHRLRKHHTFARGSDPIEMERVVALAEAAGDGEHGDAGP